MNKSQLPFSKKMHVRGKFLFYGIEKFYIKGVTYGTFKPSEDSSQFPDIETIEKDFEMMAQQGINSVRTYTVPPLHLLDIADTYNLKVMVGLPWEQHITFLDEPQRKKDIIQRIKSDVLACENHPAVLCFTIGNEIPATIVRWYGKKRIENFLRQLYNAVKEINNAALVTYVNYPTTEYLDLSFLDFDCFNVYLETPEKLSKYILRLHNLSGDRPLVLAEIGLDSCRNGLEKQAQTLTWQIQTIFEKGCAGMFVFAWTDEWWRGGFEIEDWDFGMVDRQRNAKPALPAVSAALQEVPFSSRELWPAVTVIVCSFNGSPTIRECLEGILSLDYPNFDVIVVNDGSTDDTAEIAQQFPVKLINTSNQGLSNARNTGMHNASGEIIAYIDDDAYPDPHWLHYLVCAYVHSNHACIGGPNIAPYDQGLISTCVANAPGGPVHVLLSDEIAEHVPGCNMSFRREALMKIGGFDPQFRTAGDDVDTCWRIQESGNTIGFHPSAVVWHRCRNSFTAYWKQQKGYGKAEALLEAKWPEKYNSLGHLTWAGRIYGNGFTLPIKLRKDKIFHGTWGSALFQSIYQPAGNFINSIPLMPEWYLMSAALLFFGCLGFLWPPLLWFLVAFVASVAVVFIQAVVSAKKNSALQPEQKKHPKFFLLIVLLHLVQPVARLYGRFANGLTPWRIRGAGLTLNDFYCFQSKTFTFWSEEWQSADDWLEKIENNLISLRTRVQRGGEFSRWDLQVRNGLFTKARGLLAIEEHGANKQYLKFKCSHVNSLYGLLFIAFLVLAGITMAFYKVWPISFFALFVAMFLGMKYITDSISVTTSLRNGFAMLGEDKENNSDLKMVEKNAPSSGEIHALNNGSIKNEWMNAEQLEIVNKDD